MKRVKSRGREGERQGVCVVCVLGGRSGVKKKERKKERKKRAGEGRQADRQKEAGKRMVGAGERKRREGRCVWGLVMGECSGGY